MDPQSHEDRRRETESAWPIVDESPDSGPFDALAEQDEMDAADARAKASR